MQQAPTIIEQKLDDSRRRLLDLTRRNRLLNFRGKGNRSLRIVGAEPAEVYQLLVKNEKTRLEFLAAEEAGLKPADDDTPATQEPVEIQTARLQTRQPHQLATTLEKEKLDRRLLFLDREAESALQEQGCNILYIALGLLTWKGADHSNVASDAPLVLVPIDLTREDVSDRYKAVLWDSEVVINPALHELCRRDYRLTLPSELDPETDLDEYFDSIEKAITKLDGWSIKREVHLGLFSFAKLLMYLDLDPTRWPEQSITQHPFVRGLCGLTDNLPECGDCTQADELDEIPPDVTFQVLDADSSQQVAILAAKKGTSMVIEGPPGTGKSQTITNIIAECLSEGKTVLFVAEKAAALEVVKKRLKSVQLGDFVLELHSRKASKREIIEELGRVMNASYTAPRQLEMDARDLGKLRGKLNQYVRLLHEPRPPLQKSLFDGMAEYIPLRAVPEAAIDMRALLSHDHDKLERIKELVSLLSRARTRSGDIGVHPWRGVQVDQISLELRQQLPELIDATRKVVGEIQTTSAAVVNLLDARPPVCRNESQQLLDLVKLILQTTTLTPEALSGSPWTEPPFDVDKLLRAGKRIGQIRSALGAHWSLTAENIDWRAVCKRRSRQVFSIWRWLQPSFYQDNKLICQYSDYPFIPPNHVVDDLLLLVELAQQKRVFKADESHGVKRFGKLWRGLESNWQSLADHAAAMDQISRLLAEERTSLTALGRVCTLEGKLQLKSEAQHFVSVCNTLLGKYRELSQLLKLDFTAFLGQSAEETPFEKWKQRLDECATARDRISEIATCNSAARNCADAGLENFLRWTVEHNDVSPECWPNVFYRQFLLNWIFAHFSELPEFREFQQLDHQALIERFREADKHWLKMSQQRLATSVAARRPQMSNSTVKTSRLGVLKAEMRRKRGLKPIRQLFSLVGDAVQALKPCFMMSPISVAQYLQPGNMEFDVVIFDEASQVEPADALGAVARGRQLILVGDEKQLPPTNFFETVSIPDETTPDDDRPDTGDLESVLAQGIVMFPNPKALRWHYRSKHNSLIEFSNDEFYNHDLRVFPSPEFRTGDVGLSFRLIANGVYLRGKGQYNEVEAHAVAECVIEHARTFPKKSLGVGAFSAAQQRAIQDAVEQLRRDADDSQLEEFFGRDTDEPFFVKNLETIQGDERDVILLSVGYGPDNDGKITMNFGPINKDTGWRRLNVLVTRAKERCVVFSSLTSDQMHSDSASPRGVQALKRYLYFAQHGKLPTVGGNSGEHDSPFERDVATALREHNWEVDAQIGSAGFFIDLAVVDPRAPGRYLLGVECDGATYHRAATARDRDRLRQAVLEGLGWSLHRIWSTDWFERRSQTLAALLEKLDGLVHRQVSEQSKSSLNPTNALSAGERAPESSNRPLANDAIEPDLPNAAVDVGGLNSDPATILAGIVPYQRYSRHGLGTKDTLLAIGPEKLIKVLVDVVAIEGPIHLDELCKVVASLFSARITGATKHRLYTTVDLAVRTGRLTRHGDFLWDIRPHAITPRWRGNDDAVTTAQLICAEEVAAAAVLVAQHSFGIPADDLASATLRALGFKRIGQPLAELGRAAVELALREKRIVADAAGFMVPAESH